MAEPKTQRNEGNYKTGKVRLYINKLTDVDFEVLREIVKKSGKNQG